MKILAIESSCDETAAAVIDLQTTTDKRQPRNSKDFNQLLIGDCLLSVNILSNVVSSQIDLHKEYGGVFPEIASRAHTENIIPVIEKALENAESLELSTENLEKKFKFQPSNLRSQISDPNSVDLIAITVGPGLIGSLLVGVNTAKTLAYVSNKPIMPINHWLGHIYSCWAVINSNLADAVIHSDSSQDDQSLNHNQSQSITFPLIALIVSGGHTGLVLMKSHTEIMTLGETLDDAVGEAFDKVAKLLQLPYPGGPSIAQAADEYKKVINSNLADAVISRDSLSNNQSLNHHKSQPITPNIHFPRAMMDRPDYNFSFSGLKTAVLNKVRDLENKVINSDSLSNNKSPNHGLPNHYKQLVAYEFQQCVIDILISKTMRAAEEYQPKSILLCGGVSANKELREQMRQKVTQSLSDSVTFFTPPLSLTTDNAAMIGLAAAYQIANGIPATDYSQIDANSNLKL